MLNNSRTYDDGDLPIRLWKRIRAGPVSRPDDQGSVQGCPEAGDVSMPPQGALLPGDVEPVGEVAVRQDGALGDHRHSVGPTVEPLLHSMPASENTNGRIENKNDVNFAISQVLKTSLFFKHLTHQYVCRKLYCTRRFFFSLEQRNRLSN